MIMLLSVRREIMGQFCISRLMSIGGWVATAVMAVASVIFLVLSV
jgi:Mn2+/Fe2+ NRAMP family transporter